MKESIVLLAITKPGKDIMLDDIRMVTSDLSEVYAFIEKAISMNKTLYLNKSGDEAVNAFIKGWECITTVGDELSAEYICSEMNNRLSDIHLQVWQDGEIKGGRLYGQK